MIRWCKVKQLYLIRNIDRKLETQTQTQTLKRRSFLSALLCCKLDYVVIYEFWVPIFTSVLFKPLFSTLYQTLKRRQYADSRARNTCTNPDWSYDEGNARWLFVVFDNRNILLYDYDSLTSKLLFNSVSDVKAPSICRQQSKKHLYKSWLKQWWGQCRLFVVFDNINILLYDYNSKHSLTLLFIRNVLWCMLFRSVSSIQLS